MSSLPKLTDVARLDVPSNVLANIGPPVPLREEGVGCVEAAVPRIIVDGLHCSGALSIIEYVLMGALWVSFPYLAMIDKEISGVADDECVLVIRDMFWPLQGHKPVVGFVETLICIGCHVGARCGVQDIVILICAKVCGHLREMLMRGERSKQIGQNGGWNCWIEEVGEAIEVVDPIIEFFLIFLLFLVYVVGLGRSPGQTIWAVSLTGHMPKLKVEH